MAVETLWLRAAYPLWARLPRHKAKWHAVSEAVPVEVPVVAPEDAPLALRVSRPMHGRTRSDAQLWGTLKGHHSPPEGQVIDVRMTESRLLAPVIGPDGRTPMSPEAIRLAEGDLLAARARDRAHLGRHVTWDAYPGAAPTNSRDPDPRTRRWPDVTASHVHRPLWDCEDLGTAGFADVDGEARDAALRRFREAVAGLALIDGVLWAECGIPAMVTNLSGPKGARLVLPRSDPFPKSVGPKTLAVLTLDHRTRTPDGMEPFDVGSSVEAFLDVPRDDHAVENLVALRRHARKTLADVTFEALPTPLFALMGWAHEASDRALAGEDGAALEAETCRRMRAALADPRTARARHDTVAAFAKTLTHWAALVEADRAAILDAQAELDLEGLSLGA